MALPLMAAPKGKRTPTKIKAWTLPLYTAQADTVAVDTAFLNQPNRNMLDDYSVSNVWNGNIVSPAQSRLYFKRLNKIDDLFGRQYEPFIITPQDVRFYNTTTPFSALGYQHGFTTYHEEHDLDFLFTGNFNKRTNVGITLNYLNSPGHYLNQEASLFNGAVWGSYNGNQYFLHAAFTWNTLKNFENGGIQNVSDLSGPLNPEEIPVNMKAMSGYTYLSGLLNHGYSLTVQRRHTDSIEVRNEFGEWEKRDTILTEYVPVTTFSHTFEVNNSNRRYVEQSHNTYYADWHRSYGHTNDSSNVLTIKNTLAVTFEEAFNTKLRFGAMVYARNEFQRYTYLRNEVYQPIGSDNLADWATLDTVGTYFGKERLIAYQWTNNTYVGGSIYKRIGANFHYTVNGDVCVVGYKLGQFDVNGKVDFNFKLGKDELTLDAHVRVHNDKPYYFYHNYVSNHYDWQHDYRSEMHFQVGGVVRYPTQWIKPSVDINFENITNYIYFDATGNPIQHDGNVQVFSADVRVDLTTPWVNLENNVIYQYASKEIPVPTIVLYHNLYYHGTWFKALDAQIGVDMRYFTKYYAQVLNPATGQFCTQYETQIGNYPVMNVYAGFNVRLIHLKFYVHYTHFNHLFMRSSTEYLAMPAYPMNPDIFRLGIKWNFYN